MQNIHSSDNRRIWITWVLISISICVYFWMRESFRLSPELTQSHWIMWGAAHPGRIWGGEIWRLVTAIFLHGNILHLVFNGLVLFQSGQLLEPIIGWSRFLFIFLVSGIVSFSLSLIINGSMAIGSSGAVFGLIGALVGLFLILPRELTDPRLLRALILFILINIALGLFINWKLHSIVIIDNVAHMGGLISGFMLGISFGVDTASFQIFKGRPRIWRRTLSIMALVMSYALLFGSVSLCVHPFFSVEYHYQRGLLALLEDDLPKVQKSIDALVDMDRIELAYFLQGRIAIKQKHKDEAKRLFSKALDKLTRTQRNWEEIFANIYQVNLNDMLFNDEQASGTLCSLFVGNKEKQIDPAILNDCAWLLLMAHDHQVHDAKQALEWAKQAVRLKGTSPDILHTLAESYAQNGRPDEAVIAMDRAILQQREIPNFFIKERQRFEKQARLFFSKENSNEKSSNEHHQR